MSEKKLREIVKPLVDHWTDARLYHDQFQEALAEEPDVAKMLRKAKEMLGKVDADLATKPQNIVTYDQLVGMQNTLDEIIRWLEETVRLTDASWEWTE